MRTSKTIITLISVNVVIFIIAMGLTSSQQREIRETEQDLCRLDSQMGKIEKGFIGFREAMEGISGHISTKEAKREFKRVLRERIEEGAVIPGGTSEHIRWSTLYAHYKELQKELLTKREGFIFNRFGFIPRYPDALSLLSSFFLHISLFSLFFNMLFLYIVGSILEDRWGDYFLTLIYIGGGIFGSLIHWMLSPLSDISIVGASSAVAILMGVFIVACWGEKIKFFFWVSSIFIFVCWLIQLIFQPVFEPLEVVSGHGILSTLIVAVLGVVGGLARTGRLSRSTHTQEPLSPYHRMIDQGNELFELANFDKAKWVFGRVIEGEPDNLEAHEGLARIYAYQNQDEEAISEYNRVIEIGIKKGSSSILERYETFQKVYPETILEPENQYHIARILEKDERFDEAIEGYRKVFTAYPEHALAPKALYGIGRICLRLNRIEEAIGSYEEILKRYPQIEWIDQVKTGIKKAKGLGH